MTTADDTATRTREIAYQLLIEGTNPSWRAVRERLGKGSSATINTALKEFWADIRQRLSRPELPPAVADLCHTLWQRALDEADGQWTTEREGLHQELTTTREALADSAAQREALVKEVERVRRDVEDRDRQLTEAARRVEKLKRERDRTREARAVAEQAMGAAMSREQAREQELLGELERVRKELQRREVEFGQREERWEAMARENERWNDRLREMDRRMVALQDQERESALAVARAEAEAAVLRQQVKALLARVGGD